MRCATNNRCRQACRAGARAGHARLRRGLVSAAALIAAGVGATLIAGCAVGPDFHRPAPPDTTRYLHTSAVTAPQQMQAQPGDTQRLGLGDELTGEWWQLFHSRQLDEVVRAALAASPTLAAANATLTQAREEVNVARGALMPAASASLQAQRAGSGGRIPGAASTSNLYTIGAAAGYSPDIFGGVRRNVEQQRALAEYQDDQLAAAYLTLTGDVVDQVLTIASTRLQISTAYDLIAIDQKNLALSQREFAVGVGTRADVLTADAQLAADQTQLPALQKQLDQAYDQLAVLAGRTPASWQVQAFDLQQFALPRNVPLSLPSRLVRQRPDILAAEAQLHAASAAVGVAVAEELPNIDLSASLTRQALQASDLFHQFDTLWGLGASLTTPLFKGGALRAQVRASRDAFRAQAATYRAVVLESLGQVADDLWALQYDAQLLTVDRHSMQVAFESLQLQQQSYTVGTTNVLNLINAQRAYAQARLAYVNAQVQQFQDTAGLLVALGGGWWNDHVEAAARGGPPGPTR